MMYLTAMRVNSKREGIGINIFLHLLDQLPDPRRPWSVVDNPGNEVEQVSWIEVRRGGNAIEAYFDLLVLDERAYDATLLSRILDETAKKIERGLPNPARLDLRDTKDDLIAHAAFSVNLGLEDLVSKRRIFRELRGALERWQTRNAREIERILQMHRATG